MERFTSRDWRYSFAVILIFLVGFILLTAPARAQQDKIIDIRVTGNINSSEKLIRSVSGFTIGERLTGGDIQEAVRKLYELGIYRDIVVDVQDVSGGVIVTLQVEEYPRLTEVEFNGNKEISDKDLFDLVRLAPGGYIADNLINQAARKIKDKYEEKKYFLAKVEPELKYKPDSSEAVLAFNIKEYSKVKVEKVFLTGAKQLEANNLIKQMSNRKRGFLRSSDFKKEKYPEDKEKLVDYARKNGFLDAYIVSDSFAIDTTRNRMSIYIDFYEGPRYYFGKTSYRGNAVYSADMLSKAIKYREGGIFNQEVYDESVAELYGAYHEKGYLHARITDDRNTRDSLIDIEFQIIEGLPAKVHLVNIQGNTKTKDKVIRREMVLRPGDTFRRSSLMRSLREIMALNFFGNVTPDVKDLPSGDIDLIVNVEEKPTGQVSAGAGYSAQDKLIGTFGLGIPNFRGVGQTIETQVEFGSERNSLSCGFTEPWLFGTPTLMGVDLYSLNRDWYNDFYEGRRGGSVRIGRRLRWPDNYFRIYFRYRLENVRYYDFSDAYLSLNGETVVNSNGESEYVPFENSLQSYSEEWLTTSSFSFTIERDSRNMPMFPTSGADISYTGEVSGGLLGGTWDYYKHLVTIKKYFPLFWGFSISGNARFGYISAKFVDDVTYSQRFTPGGTDPDGNIRGYKDGEVTPVSRTGSITPGIAEVVYNFELQIPVVSQQIYLLAFADAGNSWLHKNDIKPFSGLYRGIGVGFRLVVPAVGVIGFDFGYALDNLRDAGKGWKPHFQVSAGY